MPEQTKGLRKGEVAYIIAIVLGLLIGFLVKKIRVGVFISLALCLVIALSGWFRFTRK